VRPRKRKKKQVVHAEVGMVQDSKADLGGRLNLGTMSITCCVTRLLIEAIYGYYSDKTGH